MLLVSHQFDFCRTKEMSETVHVTFTVHVDHGFASKTFSTEHFQQIAAGPKFVLSGTIGDFVKKKMYLHFWILLLFQR